MPMETYLATSWLGEEVDGCAAGKFWCGSLETLTSGQKRHSRRR